MFRRASIAAALALFAVSWPSYAAPPAALGPVVGRVIWVDFWASWCVPCRRSFPWLNEMQRKYEAAGLEIIGVNLDKERALADAFLTEVPAAFALRFDPAGALAKEFKVQSMPSSYLIDTNGKVLTAHYGFRTADTEQYERAIKTALASVDVSSQ